MPTAKKKSSGQKCSYCGSTKMQRHGTTILVSGTRSRFKCMSCGHTTQGKLVPRKKVTKSRKAGG